MGRRKQEWTEAKFQHYIKEGRSGGRGSDLNSYETYSFLSSSGQMMLSLSRTLN